ncbi:hypothetical protein HZS_1126 [Henneguya salminicola]|nr:hypothetical protein HZS_1126 [Henneguya salminicola]
MCLIYVYFPKEFVLFLQKLIKGIYNNINFCKIKNYTENYEEYKWGVKLDGKVIDTPKGNQLIIRKINIALIVGVEWQVQPLFMCLTSLIFSTTDIQLRYFPYNSAELNIMQNIRWHPLIEWINKKFLNRIRKFEGILLQIKNI